MEKIIRLLFTWPKIILIALFICGCQPYDALSTSPTVRVAVLHDAKEINLSIRGQYKIVNPLTESVLFEGRYLKDRTISIKNQNILVGTVDAQCNRIRIYPQKDVAIDIKGERKRYRDVIDIIVTKAGDLLAVNVINLEKYVKGVLYHEVSHRWPLQALKAQAVAARTYALYQTKVNQQRDYDVRSDVYSQMYGGRNAETYRTNLAVNRTKDEVLYYKNQILPAYYHSNCGGHTEDVRELWNHDLKPLRGVKCPYCKGQPGYTWRKNFQSKNIQALLNQKGYAIGLIKNIEIVERTDSGRVKRLKIEDRSQKSLFINGKDFRDIVGPNYLKSNLYEIEMKGFYFDVIGKGWGHGVGLCQWGMHTMSRLGYDYREILSFYYPGITIARSELIDRLKNGIE